MTNNKRKLEQKEGQPVQDESKKVCAIPRHGQLGKQRRFSFLGEKDTWHLAMELANHWEGHPPAKTVRHPSDAGLQESSDVSDTDSEATLEWGKHSPVKDLQTDFDKADDAADYDVDEAELKRCLAEFSPREHRALPGPPSKVDDIEP